MEEIKIQFWQVSAGRSTLTPAVVLLFETESGGLPYFEASLYYIVMTRAACDTE